MKNLKVKGFTLAETLITLTILGVVAAITIPALINKYNESANRTKLKKAMAAYEKALNQMIVDNDIKGSITAVEGFRLTDNCSGSRPYFKAIKEITGNNCRFQTADKVWWDITDIEHPVISLKDEITDENIATLKGNADNLEDNKTSFIMVGELKDGIVRINDKGGVVKDSDNEKYLDKLYSFVNNVETTTGETAIGISSFKGRSLISDDYWENNDSYSDTIDGINIEANKPDLGVTTNNLLFYSNDIGGITEFGVDKNLTFGSGTSCGGFGDTVESVCKSIGYTTCTTGVEDEGYINCTKD